MKKSLILISLLLLSLTLFVGCADENAESSNSGNVEPNDTVTTSYVFPEEQADSPGLSNFSTLDVYGTTVDQTIFSASAVTMVNIWGTFCSPCLQEMPYLAELDKEYEDQGFNIVGMVVDVQNGDGSINMDQIDTVNEIIGSTGADYTHILPSNNLISGLLSNVQYIPHTVFVDSQGQIISEDYVGSRSKEEWAEIIESML